MRMRRDIGQFLKEKITVEDYQQITTAAIDVTCSNPTMPQNSFPKEVLKRTPKRIAGKLSRNPFRMGAANLVKVILDHGDELFPDEARIYFAKKSELKRDPLAVLAHVKGKVLSETAKSLIKIYLFEALEDLKGKLSPQEKRAKAFRMAFDKVERYLDKEAASILLDRRRTLLSDAIESGFSEWETTCYEMHLSGKAGLFEAKTSTKAALSDAPTSGFARALAAEEQGKGAQAKNPRSRIDSSRQKMNRNGGPG